MLRSRFFWRLFFSYFLLVAGTSAVLGVLTYRHFASVILTTEMSALKSELISLAAVGEVLLNPSASDASERARQMRGSPTRVSAILPNGKVAFDSEADPASMEDHSDRIEVYDALKNGFGEARRRSVSTGIDQLYVAARVDRAGQTLGVVRVSFPLQLEREALGRLKRRFLYSGLWALGLALAVALWVARTVTRPLEEVRVVAEALRAGDYQSRVIRPRKDEIGHLGEALNRLAAELREKISSLAHEEGQLRAILASMVEGVLAIDEKGEILYHNAAAALLIGRDGEASLAGKRIWQFTELREIRETAEGVHSRGAPDQREVALYLEKGKRVLNLYASPFQSLVSRGAIVVLQDITELRRLESVRRDFVANVSHELKTPLTSIKGYVETLLDGALQDEKHNRRFVEKIEKHVNHLTELVQDLLSLGELESENRKLNFEAADWNRTLDEVVSRHELEVERKRLVCRRETAPTARVRGDTYAMFQIASNLFSNAVKYTPEGGTVLVRTYEKDGYGCFEVVDTGVGIPEKELPRIFERFYRVDKARSREVGGTGLGLSIVKHLVSALEGEIRVESRVGGGTKFTVRLPQGGGQNGPQKAT